MGEGGLSGERKPLRLTNLSPESGSDHEASGKAEPTCRWFGVPPDPIVPDGEAPPGPTVSDGEAERGGF